MKANAVPELNKKWWDQNKAMTLPKTGLGQALQNYEIAQAKKDDVLVLQRISEIKKVLAVAVTKADTKRHAETIAALKKYPKLLEDQTRLANERIKRAPKVAPPQKAGKVVTIWSIDVTEQVRKKANPDWLESFKGQKLALTLDDSILNALDAEGDLVTPAFMVEDAQKIGTAAVAQIVKFIGDIQTATNGKTPEIVNKGRARLEVAVKTVLTDAATKLKGVPEARWKTFVARNQQYKDYKVKAGVDLSLGVVGVVGAGAGIVGSGGAGLALGIVALVRGTAAVVKQVYDLALDADKVGKDLKKDCDTLLARYLDAQGQAKGNTAATEVPATVLKSILGTDAPFLATIPKAKNNLELWDNKIAGVTVNGRKVSKAITEALKKCNELEAKIKNAQDKEAKDIYKKIVQMEKALDEALTKTSDLMAKVSRFEENAPKLEQVLDALEKTSDFARVFDKVFPTVVNLALSGASFGVGFAGAKDANESMNAAISFAGDLSGIGKDVLEKVLG